MSWIQIVCVIYGLINIAGGIFGYIKAQSTLSLLVGVGVGIVILGLVALSKTKPAVAFRTLGLVCVGLAIFWITRAQGLSAEGKSAMMAYMNFGLSDVVLTCLVMAHFLAQKKKNSIVD